MAYKIFELENVIKLDQCRLIKYDEHSDSLEKSYEGEEMTDMSTLLGGVKSSYTFDLLLETRTADQTFTEYKSGGVTVKVFVVDIEREIIHPPVNIRAYHVQTVKEFKNLVSQKLNLPAENMRVVFERFHNDLRLLTVPNKTLKAEGFFKSNKVYIECSQKKEENMESFPRSKFYQLLDRHQNTIRVYVNLPTKAVETLRNSVRWNRTVAALVPNLSDKCDDIDNCDMNKLDSGEHCVNSDNEEINQPLTQDGLQNSIQFNFKVWLPHLATPGLNDSTASGSGSNSVVSDTTISNRKDEEENWDLDTIPTSSTSTQSETSFQDEPVEDVRFYFYVDVDENQTPDSRSLTVYVDKRISLGAFKKELEMYVGTNSENFKVYRVYSNNQEFESIRLSDTLTFLEDGRLNIKLGRALQAGEHRVKVYQLLVNQPEPCKYLVETIFAKGMSVVESKKLTLPEIKEQVSLDIPLSRCRFRKKTWKNPGVVYLDSQIYDDDIAIFPNWEVFLEVLDGPETKTVATQLAVYVRRWRSSTYTFEPFQEVVLRQETLEELKTKISEISSIPVDNIDYGKGKGTFPCELSVLEVDTEVDWNPPCVKLSQLYICDDGHVIYYKDRTEQPGELTEEQKKEMQQKENIRIAKYSPKMLTYSPRKEKALKIYTDDSPPSSSKLSLDID
ncbi:hypothetical protein LOTGIDRAFT_206027 [Lottia gigantea]|uniref:Uncharacterized protein n=1 Tax=Lottia gigantea TaxID=225164 RepID=V4AIQ3_LOTGI|nr:hypothetical protein LOTGIDRAFT_206027 [Lottia gigantea]ESP03989.1 hypothetical protein LOTGIDRAFT_206027 [Lottia gigantea]